MSKKPLDPAGHVSLAASDLKRSTQFYKNLFNQLGFKQIKNTAWVTQNGFGIWLRQAKQANLPHKHHAPGLHHICVKAKNRKSVDEIYRRLLAKKTFVFAEPRSYPEYTPKYYAVSFADPDGIKVEIAYY